MKEVRGRTSEVSQWKLKEHLIKHHLLWHVVSEVLKNPSANKSSQIKCGAQCIVNSSTWPVSKLERI